ncbi:zinc finger protein 271-like [Stegastes partitus]|uniref:Zinc finger protein 271-like n=1 Tax=Stegastes partitus TaxID=144197 RepID=A0A9Y4NH77_9TELE|nr:PREDICTED: zinc finger protein 271-like [Stegastes partitus]
MSKSQQLKCSVRRPLLTAARRQLIVRLERSIPGYEQRVDRQTELLDLVSKPDVLRRTDIRQLLVNKGDVSTEQQDREDPHNKEEQMGLCPVQRPTEGNGEDCGGSDSDFPELDGDDSDKDWNPLDSHKTISTVGEKFSCSLCSKRFAKRQSLQYHLKTHRGVKPFSCSVCNKRFMQKGNLKYHMIVHSGERPYSCSVCSRTFRWPAQVKAHKCKLSEQHRKQPKKPLSCSKCAETFPDRLLLRAHKKIHQEKNLLSCSVCGVQVRFRSQLQIHMRKHTGEKPYSCSICGKRFSQIGITKQHMLVHAKEKPFSCTDCGKRFSWHFQIKRHKCGTRFWQYSGSEALWSLDPDQRLKLGTYKKTNAETETADSDSDFWKETRKHQLGFTYQRNKKLSESDRQSDTDKKVQCCPDVETQPKNEDSDVFSQSRCLQRNCETHENSGSHSDRTLLNSESQREPEDRDTQLTHPRQSTAEKPFSCSLCGKGFATGGCLTRHTSIHTGEKLLSCFICEKTFNEESELISHECVGKTLQRHQTEEQITANKTFSCSVCPERFSRREDFSFHFRRHPRCSVCNAGFSDRDSLVQHMRSHTSQTQFLCSVCGKDFAWRRHLTKHMEDHAKKKLYHCGICGRKFTCPKKLSHHWCVRRSSQLLLSSSAEHMEADGEDCGEPEPEPYLQAETEDKAAESSDPDTDDSDCWKENRRAQYTSEKHHEVPESDTTLYRKTFIQQLPYGEDLSQHMVFHSELQREEKQKDIQEEQEEPELTAIKEEQEDTAITKFIFSSLQIKTEEDEEKPQSSQLHQRDSVREPEPDLHPDSDVGGVYFKSDDSVDSDFWKDTRQRQSGNDSDRNLFSSSEETNLQPESDDSTDSDFWKSHSGSNSLQHDGISDREVKDDAKRKPYSCTECSKTFHYIFHMKTHMKLHTEERPFFCSICGQKCLYKSHLKIHMRTHTGEKPFVCPICGKKYAHKASMQSHMSEHAKHYSCSVCERSFAWYTELKYHQCAGESSHRQTYRRQTM